MAKYGKKTQDKVRKVMHEKKEGKLRSGGSHKKVTSRKQAIAIALSEARREGDKAPPNPNRKSHARKSTKKSSATKSTKKSSARKGTKKTATKKSSPRKSKAKKPAKRSASKRSTKKSSAKKSAPRKSSKK